MIKITDGNEKGLKDIKRMNDVKAVNIFLPLIERKTDVPILILNHHVL